jgi:hypothetical protein
MTLGRRRKSSNPQIFSGRGVKGSRFQISGVGLERKGTESTGIDGTRRVDVVVAGRSAPCGLSGACWIRPGRPATPFTVHIQCAMERA